MQSERDEAQPREVVHRLAIQMLSLPTTGCLLRALWIGQIPGGVDIPPV